MDLYIGKGFDAAHANEVKEKMANVIPAIPVDRMVWRTFKNRRFTLPPYVSVLEWVPMRSSVFKTKRTGLGDRLWQSDAAKIGPKLKDYETGSVIKFLWEFRHTLCQKPDGEECTRQHL